MDNLEVDNLEVDNLEVDNLEVDNLEVDNLEVDNLEVDNLEVDNLEVDNLEVTIWKWKIWENLDWTKFGGGTNLKDENFVRLSNLSHLRIPFTFKFFPPPTFEFRPSKFCPHFQISSIQIRRCDKFGRGGRNSEEVDEIWGRNLEMRGGRNLELI